MDFIKAKSDSFFLFLLVLFDFIFTIIHYAHQYIACFVVPKYLLLHTLYGVPELYQFIKYGLILYIILLLLLKKKETKYIPLFVLFTVIFLDDVFQLHYLFGNWIFKAYVLHDAFGFQGKILGRIIYILILCFIASILYLFGIFRSTPKIKNHYNVIYIILFFLLFFGFFVDILQYYYTNPMLSLVEESGEMFTLSTLLWFFRRISMANIGQR